MTPSAYVATAGASLAREGGHDILLPRGASAESVLGLAEVFGQPDVAYLAPRAPGGSWYPYSFLALIDQNEPQLSRALAAVEKLVEELDGQGFGAERLALLGFSQGGCLALEFAARNARRYGAVIGLSAGLIGPADRRRVRGLARWHACVPGL